MSKVIIITNHAMSEVEKYGTPRIMDAVLFRDKIGYPTEFAVTSKLYAKLLVLKYQALAEKSTDLYRLLDLSGTEADLSLLTEMVPKVRNFSGMTEKDKSYCDSDIKKGNVKGLIKDLYAALKKLDTAKELELFSSYVSKKPLCYCLERNENNENYKIIGISCLPDKGKWMKYSEQWINALIQDFTKEEDEIILALHGATDWKEASPFLGSYPKESEEWSNDTNRKIRIILFNHTDQVGQVLKMDGSSLSDIWNYIDDIWNK